MIIFSNRFIWVLIYFIPRFKISVDLKLEYQQLNLLNLIYFLSTSNSILVNCEYNLPFMANSIGTKTAGANSAEHHIFFSFKSAICNIFEMIGTKNDVNVETSWIFLLFSYDKVRDADVGYVKKNYIATSKQKRCLWAVSD